MGYIFRIRGFAQDITLFYATIFGLSVTLIGSVAFGLYKNKVYLDRLKKELEIQQQKDAEKNQVKHVIIK
ncbi:hypothetical protein F9854_08795 [Glaesserella parasuis]|uniref:hypothetical protein n=1 Tax=Glaesserella parasuis TaxID=738 RepID=UPI001355693B|nr:hypothetical protein [Glaesserella parasuis]MWQ87520.1 hypothetical protein [Glaesserella parasuis]